MQYRKFGRVDWNASVLGFGCMRFPTSGDPPTIDEPEATKMLHYAIDNGVNYLDTAYPYHGGDSERFLGRALQGGYRQKVRLATKMPTWQTNKYDDFDRIFEEQLARLQVEYVDFYLLHALSKDWWHKVRDLGVLDWCEGAMADGRIGHLGFSFHDEYEEFQEIVDAYDGWTFCQIQHNYIDIEEQAGTKGLLYAASKGLAVVVMEPILGGRLANPPEPIQDLWDAAPRKRTAACWALQWLWNQPEVTVVLSGMSTMMQVRENVVSAGMAEAGKLTEEEVALVDKVRDKYLELCPIPCTRCRYCMPCPNGVDIPRNFTVYDEGMMYNQIEQARRGYDGISEEARASACIQCRECEDKCPQHIIISEWMPIVHRVLGEDQAYPMCVGAQPH